MSAPRFVAFLGEHEKGSVSTRPFEGLSHVPLEAPISLWATDHALRLGDHGAIIGHLFTRSIPSRPITELNPAEINAALVTRGQSLFRDYWGGYVAIFRDAGGDLVVMRDPSGALPAFWREVDGMVAVAAQIGDPPFSAADGLRVDADALLVHLWNPHHAGEQTCLTGVRELLSGQRLQITPSGRHTDALWLPWSFLADGGDVSLPSPAAFRATIVNGIRTWADAFPAVLCGLSGGLDSSIVSWGISQSSARLQGLHMNWPDREGDERDYALAMAATLGLTLDMADYDLNMIDIERPIVTHVARPFTAHYAQCTAAAQTEIARQSEIGAIFTGHGGDNVFCLIQSVAPILDRLKARQGAIGVLKTVKDVATLTSADYPTILLHLGRRITRDPRSPAGRGDPTYLDPARLARALTSVVRHLWYDPPDGIAQGAAAHIRALCRGMGNDGFHDRRTNPPSISPLLSQPIMEACLKIPTWNWIEGGVDRAVARRAFAHDLPQSILSRRTKGGPAGFLDRYYWENEGRILSYLKTGLLSDMGLLAHLPEVLSAGGRKGYDRSHARRLLGLTGAESWARSWAG